MNGGVSLAVWIGGAVAEIDTMRRGSKDDPFWPELLMACGYVRAAQVDVMAGASAGGLNAVMMAQAIRSDTSFDQFLGLWEDAADISVLVKGPLHANRREPRGVFRGWYFLETLRAALDLPAKPELPHDVAVFASATLVRANPAEFRDVPGEPIHETRSDAYFHVARRGTSSRGLDGFQPSNLVMGTTDALAHIGRATSSLPGLFEPVKFTNTDQRDGPPFAARLVGGFTTDRDEVQVMDGGVVDNVPIARAIRAIAASQSVGVVRRVLVYLHPDPGDPPAPTDPQTALGVAKAFGGKRSETIREDIEVLRAHNDRVARRAAQMAALLEDYLAAGEMTRSAAADLRHEIAAGTLLRAAVDPAGEMPWHAPSVARVSPLVDGSDQPSKQEVADDVAVALRSSTDLLLAMAARRQVTAIMTLISTVQPTSGANFRAVNRRLHAALNFCDVVHSYQLARFLGHGAGGATVTRLLASRDELMAARVTFPLGNSQWRALAGWDIGALAASPGRTLDIPTCLTRHVHAAIGRLPEVQGTSPAAQVLERLRAGRMTPEQLERIMLPLAAEPAISDQHIDFVRIAGDAPNPAADAFERAAGGADDAAARGLKIAGRQLAHLGAFFDKGWRTNDWWWGRLDSVEPLLDAVLDDQAVAAMFAGGFAEQLGLEPEARTEADVRKALVERRQLQLLNTRLGTKHATMAAATADPAFVRWARTDRRLQSLIGSRRLTSAAVRTTLTTSKALAWQRSPWARGLLRLTRPLLLMVVGIVMSGLAAATSAVWTLCVLAAPRQHDWVDRWAVYTVGAVTSSVLLWFVTTVIRPRGVGHRVLPYVGFGVGLVVGAIATAFGPADTSTGWWVLAGAAAAVAAIPLFYWMHRWAAVVAVTVVGLAYGATAWYATVPHPAQRDYSWPLHTMWVTWLVAIIGTPWVLGVLPDSVLSPEAPSRDTSPQRR